MKISILIQKIGALRSDLPTLCEKAINESADGLTELQKEQMASGMDSKGGIIEKSRGADYPYSKGYAKRKASLGLQTSVVDLKLTGSFYSGIIAKAEGGKVVIKSNDEKAKYLEENYGRDLIFGLSPQTKSVFIQEHLQKSFTNIIKAAIYE